jgi:hypothetical protein
MNQKDDRHEVFAGFRKEGAVENRLLIGAAFKNSDEPYYKIRLMMFPGNIYYLVKNRDTGERFTIFSRILNTENGIKFLNPVGSGVLDSNLQSYLELRFPLLRTGIFMSLFPVNG